MKKKILRLLPFGIFMAFMLLPAFAAITGTPKVAPLEEYRKPEEPPLIADYFGEPGVQIVKYNRHWDRWFSDNFPARPILVRLYTQILYSVFNESDQVHVGNGNWLYYRDVIDNVTPGLQKISPASSEEMIERMSRLTELLRERDIELFIMPLALKHRYYPEYLPSSAAHANNFEFYDSFMDAASQVPGIGLIDSRPILEEAKTNGLKTFHRTDFHWTDPAGSLVAKKLLEEIAILEGKPEVLDLWKYKVVNEEDLVGGQARALPLFSQPNELTIGIKEVAPKTKFAYKTNENGIEWQGIADRDQGERFRPILVYGDSFFDAPARGGFYSMFGSFARARLYSNDIVEAFNNRPAGTRYMVIEYITSATAGMDNSIRALLDALESSEASRKQ